MIIDGYSHLCPPEYVNEIVKLSSINSKLGEAVKKLEWYTTVKPASSLKFTQFCDARKRVEHLDKYKIDKQIACMIHLIDANVLPLKEDEVVRLCRIFNDGMAEEMRKAKGRVYTTASVPLNSPHLEDEMDRAIKDLGLKGVLVPTHVHGMAIDKFSALWARAEKLDVPVWIHPLDLETDICRPYENEYNLMHMFGWPYETTLSASRLVFSGTMQKHPRLKVILHHLGAMISFFSGRIMETYPASGVRVYPFVKELTKAPIDYYKMFYCDTAVGGDAGAVRTGVDFFGADHVFFGTDYPFGPGRGEGRLETYPSTVRNVMNQLQIPSDDQEKILWKNMISLAKLD